MNNPIRFCFQGSYPLYLEGLVPNYNDIDIIVPDDTPLDKETLKEYIKEFTKTPDKRVEVHTWPKDLYDIYEKVYNEDSIKALYTCKLSHSFFNKSFWFKTERDLAWFETNKLNRIDEYLFDKLYEYWKVFHNDDKSKINLDQPNDTFFNNRVPYKYEHDSLHKALAIYPGYPLYQFFKEDKSKALISKKLWDKAHRDWKLRLCIEELSVITLERFVLTGLETNVTKAWLLATKNLVTTMSKGFFPKFIMSNRLELREPKRDLLKTLEENQHLLVLKVNNGKVA
jgi:hypothetical protein